MRLISFGLRHAHLILIVVLWMFAIWYNEKWVPRKTLELCHWPEPEGFQMMLIADPQLIDYHTYPGRPSWLIKVSQLVTNNYLYKNYRALNNQLSPKIKVFLGDYLDNGRLDYENVATGSTINNYNHERAKFRYIFDDTSMYNVPGNHDVGWENGVTQDALDRFHDNFGYSNMVKPFSGFDLIFLDSLSLSNNVNESIYGPPRAFVDNLAKTPKENKRILFTHVPLWKDDQSLCGPLRESDSFPISKGFQYQTVLDKELSNELLTKLDLDMIFSGDDHDYCEYVHFLDNHNKQVTEVTVKSMSMAMGISKPAVELVSLVETDTEKRFKYDICYLPKPYDEVIIYSSLLFVSLVIIIVTALLRTNSYSFGKRFNIEDPVSYYRLSTPPQTGDFESNSQTEPPFRKSSYRQLNLILKHSLSLFAIVAIIYCCFTPNLLRLM